MRRLYHFVLSPLCRTRLVLAHKKLAVELVEARADPKAMETMLRLYPLRTAPVLVEEDGSVVADSNAIAEYVDRAYPGAPPAERTARRSSEGRADHGADRRRVEHGHRPRHALLRAARPRGLAGCPLREARACTRSSRRARVARVGARAADPLRVGLVDFGDMWLYCAVAWLEGLPARAPTFANAAQVLSLGWKVPEPLSRWASTHREHPDVRAL